MGKVKTGRTGEQKLLYLGKLLRDTLKDYAERTGKSQSAVASELMILGDAEFRRRHFEPKDEVKPIEERGKVEPDRGQKIAEAYGKKLVNYRDGDQGGWTEVA